ncbi:MAG: DUF1573 domain-containing protein, partial [Phycisphaerae bacterium]
MKRTGMNKWWIAASVLAGGMYLGGGTATAQENKENEAAKASQKQAGQTPANPQKDRIKIDGGVKLTPIPAPPPGVLSQANKAPTRRKTAPGTTPKGPVTGAPGIRCDKPIQDFGKAWATGSLDHEFIIRNAGDQVLKIISVKPSCGCTVARGYDREIPPGAIGKIPVSLNSKKVHNRFTKYVTVNSNDPVTPALRLQLTGEVRSYVDLAPRTVSIGHVKEGQTVTKSAKLTNNTDQDLVLTMAQNKIGPFTGELIERKPGKEFQFKVTASPPYKPKLNNAKFVLKTNLKESPEILVPVTAYVPARLDLRPASLVLPTRATKEQRRLIKFTNNGVAPVKILSASVDDSALTVEVIERKEGESYDIKLTIPANYSVSSKQKNITLNTDDAQTPTLKIPIKGRVTQTRPTEQLVGRLAPKAEFTTASGAVVKTGTNTGKVQVLDFFASWCGFCKRQIPGVAEMYKSKYASNADVQFVGISEDTLKKEGVTSPRARSPQQIETMWKQVSGGAFSHALDPTGLGREKFLVKSFPTLVLVGKDGTVQAVHFGAKANLAKTLERQIDSLLAGKKIAQNRPGAAPTNPKVKPIANT